MGALYRFLAWLALIPSALAIYFLTHVVVVLIGRFLAWISQANEVERIIENLASPAISAYASFVLPLRMLSKDSKAPAIFLSCSLIAIIGILIGFAMYGLSRASVLAALCSASVIMIASFSHLSKDKKDP